MDEQSVRDDHAEKIQKIWNYREYFMVGIIENLQMIQVVLSQHMPAERYNGLMNLCFLLYYPNVTSEEIESTLVSKIVKFASHRPEIPRKSD